MLTLTASGSVNDFSDNDKLSLQQTVAEAAGVDKSLVTIRVAAASVRVTATIAVPTSMTADEVQTSLSSTLGTANAASTALGFTVEEVPTTTVALAEPPSTPPSSPSPSLPPPPPPPLPPKPLSPPNTEDTNNVGDEDSKIANRGSMAVELMVLAIIGGHVALLCLCALCCCARKAVLKRFIFNVERREKISPQRTTVEIVARNAAPGTEEIVPRNAAQDQANHVRVQATVERVRRQQEQRSARSSTRTVPPAGEGEDGGGDKSEGGGGDGGGGDVGGGEGGGGESVGGVLRV